MRHYSGKTEDIVADEIRNALDICARVELEKDALRQYQKLSFIYIKSRDYNRLSEQVNEALEMLAEDGDNRLSYSDGNGKKVVGFVNSLKSLRTELEKRRWDAEEIERLHKKSLSCLPRVEQELAEFLKEWVNE